MFGWWCSSSIATTNYPDSWFANSGFVQVNGMNCTLLKPERCLYAVEGNGVTFAFCFELIDPVFFFFSNKIYNGCQQTIDNIQTIAIYYSPLTNRRVVAFGWWFVMIQVFFCTISWAISSPIHSEWVFECVLTMANREWKQTKNGNTWMSVTVWWSYRRGSLGLLGWPIYVMQLTALRTEKSAINNRVNWAKRLQSSMTTLVDRIAKPRVGKMLKG